MIQKAAACVVRSSDRGPELLVFRHPLAGIQLPKGSIEAGERAADAAARELAEESGVLAVHVVRRIGQHEFAADGSDTEPVACEVWHTFLLTAAEDLPDRWSHRASGSADEAGLVFEFFWMSIAAARRIVAPRYHASIDFVATAIAADPAVAPFTHGNCTL